MTKRIFFTIIAMLFMNHAFPKENNYIHKEEKNNIKKSTASGSRNKYRVLYKKNIRMRMYKTKPVPLHKGRLKQAGDYFIEMVKDNNKLIFYLYDKDGNALSNNNATGSIQIFYEGKQRVTEKLISEGNDKFTVILKKYYLKCIVSFETEGKIAKAKFKRKQKNTRTPGGRSPAPAPAPTNGNHGGHTH